MEKNNWLKEIIKLLTLVIGIYIESSGSLRNIEIYIKKSVKYIIGLILVSIPILLTIWGGLFLALFFYITTHFELSNYSVALMIAIINTLIFILCLLWFKHKIRHNNLEKSNLNTYLTKLMRLAKSINNE